MNTTRSITCFGFAALACAPLSVALGEGSELPDGSVMIPSLPFFDTGDTSDNVHDYDAVCSWASDAPDVFYTLRVPPPDPPCFLSPVGMSIMLCESSYDTKVFVLDSAFNVIACNDDYCTSSGGGQFRSVLECVSIRIGLTYHIAIDGWSGDAGVYDLIVDECGPFPPCIFSDEDCPEGALPEGEPCHEGEIPDATNGGCDEPGDPLFTSIDCGDTICGHTAQDDRTRDTDWFELTVDEPTLVEMYGQGENNIVFGRIAEGSCAPGVPECSCIAGTVDPFVTPAQCECTSLIDAAAPGRSWWFVSTVAVSSVPCGGEEPGNEYVVTFDCTPISCCASGDATQDGEVNFDDLLTILANWGNCAAPPCCELGDANGDGTIGFDDVVIALANWGPCGG